jgi:DNA-binding LytR/AlgR family response regulator
MNKIKVVIVEDEFVIGEDVRAQLQQAGYEVTAIFDKAEDACPAILASAPDLLLVDVRLAGPMDGIQLVQTISPSVTVPVIYITANSDSGTYERARLTRPNAFLVKPFSNANLLASVDLALYHFSNNTLPERIERSVAPAQDPDPFTIHRSLFIRSNGKYRKVMQQDILFIEAAGSYVHVQTLGERFTLAQNLSQFQNKAPLPNLLRIHRSYIVNIEHVDSFDERHAYVEEHKLPISENHRAEFLSKLRLL